MYKEERGGEGESIDERDTDGREGRETQSSQFHLVYSPHFVASNPYQKDPFPPFSPCMHSYVSLESQCKTSQSEL